MRTYALKKLVARGYVKSEKTGRSVFLRDAARARAAASNIASVRELLSIPTLHESGLTNEQIERCGAADAQRVGHCTTPRARGGVALKRCGALCREGTQAPTNG